MVAINFEKIINLKFKHKKNTFCREIGILAILFIVTCNNILHQVKYKRNRDGYAFKCNTLRCEEYLKYITIRSYSIFEYLFIEIKKLLIVIYSWFKEDLIIQITKDHNISKSTVVRIYDFLRNKAIQALENIDYKLGVTGIICQIDESMFRYKQKYHVGRISSENRWVFGIVDTSYTPAKYYIELVPNRSRLY
ncbi:hypothetical protein DMUE_0256 [Dictyocoela muelleri]|nr:hypothetical protein DMUE_0256 [Dictyocoela muelleri]